MKNKFKILIKLLRNFNKIPRPSGFISLAGVLIFVLLSWSVSTADVYVPDNYSTIQAAVDGANAGDTIIVRVGTYTENVDVNKSLNIKSENGAGSTIVQAANPSDHVFEINADYVNISGFTVKGVTGWKGGIYLNENVEYCYVFDNIAIDNDYGIFLFYSFHNTLTNNTANSNNQSGIYLFGSNENTLTGNIANLNENGILISAKSSSNTLTDNVASNNTCGIELSSSPYNTLTNNTMADNQHNFGVSANWRNDFTQNIDTSNTVNGKPIYYLTNEDSLVIDTSWDIGYLGIIRCNNITVKDLNLSNNIQGVLLAQSSDSRIANVTASNNYIGIQLVGSSNNTIVNNTINATHCGISLSATARDGGHHDDNRNNTLINNIANSNQGRGISFSDASHNTLINNTANWNIGGILLSDFHDGTLIGNTANYNRGSNAGGIHLSFSHRNTLINNTANFGIGIHSDGILLFTSHNNILTNNTANSNNRSGIMLQAGSSGNILTYNTVNSNNDYGIYIYHSGGSTIYFNSFVANGDNVYSSVGTNSWNSIEPITYQYNGKTYTNYIGNHWGDYTEIDSNGDGIGDTPYSIGSDKDNYPFMGFGETYSQLDPIIEPSPPVEEDNQPPTAFFTCSPASPKVGEEVILSATGSHDLDGDIKFYEWDLDGDSKFNGFTTSPEIFYYWSESSTFSVKLNVIDSVGNSDTFIRDITVQQNSWWEKIKNFFAPSVVTLSKKESDRFKLIKSELYISNYPHSNDPMNDFYWITDNQLLTILKKKINASGSDLTYEAYIIDTLHDMKLADSVAKRSLTPKPEIEKYFENMAEVNVWSEVPLLISKEALTGIIEAGGGSSIGVGVILMLPDIFQAGISLGFLDDIYYRKSLWNYFELRDTGYDPSFAFNNSAVSPIYQDETTREYFEKLWLEYGGSHISNSGGLKPEFKEQIIKQLRNLLLSGYEKYKFEPYQLYIIKCPVQVQVYDSIGRVTGLVNGTIKEEIPNSAYDNETKTILIFSSNDSYYYRVVGTDNGTYGLELNSVDGENTSTFAITNVSTLNNTVHEYTLNWSNYSQGEGGVTLKIDSDGDGTFEQTLDLNPPSPSFFYSPGNPVIGQEITFNASNSTDSDGNIISYGWDFGDGSNSSGEIVTHTYFNTGDYTVTLTITDNDSIISTYSQEIEVTCDLNHDGIITHDYNDLMTAYKCFLGITKNCDNHYRNWTLMKEEYKCFANFN